MLVGLSLTGGGARGAYQAGVARGIAEVLKAKNIHNPFTYYSGMSAGSINASFLAAHEGSFVESSETLCKLWKGIEADNVYRTDSLSLGKIGLQWMRDLSLGSAFRERLAHQLLDASPLSDLLGKHIPFEKINGNLESGKLLGVACSAFNYDEQKNVAFIQTKDKSISWVRAKRYSQQVELELSHVLASCAIPVLFAPIPVGDSYYGDGSLRNTAPLSPLIRMGCRNMILVGVRYGGASEKVTHFSHRPSISKVLGIILNGLFFDSLDMDVDRLKHINELTKNLNQLQEKSEKVNFLYIKPSKDLAQIAMDAGKSKLPKLVSYLLGGLGGKNESSELTSYLLFHSTYLDQLVELGYNDAFSIKDEIVRFYSELE